MSEISLINALVELGISGLGQQIYLGLLKNQAKSLSQLIKDVGTSRATFYKNLELLQQLGLCAKDKRGDWQAVEPGFVFAKLKAKQAKLNQITQNLEQNLDSYDRIFNLKNNNHFARIYTGRKEIQELAAKLAHDLEVDYIGFGDSSVFEGLIGDEIENFWMFQRVRKHIKLRLLLQDKNFVDVCKLTDQKDMRETRYLSHKWQISGYFNIHQNTAYCWASGHSRAIVINDEVFVSSFKAMFEIFWELGV